MADCNNQPGVSGLPPPNPSLAGYTLGERLGQGSYATVYKALSVAPGKSGVRETLAVKCILLKRCRSVAAQDNLLREIRILRDVHHPHIVDLLDFRWDKDYIYLIMEFCGGGDLSKFIRVHRQLHERVARKFTRQLASAMKYLHDRNIAHMDLKPQNILLTNTYRPHLKLADFGFAQHFFAADGELGFRGSPLYMAPEMFTKQPYDASVDLWSIGVILYECLYGAAPFACKSYADLVPQITATTEIPIPARQPPLTDICVSLLRGLLQRSPADRLTFEQFFVHAFIDLERAPSSQSLQKAAELTRKGASDEDRGDTVAALTAYCQALDHYLSALQYIDDQIERDRVRRHFSALLRRAEILKAALKPVQRPTELERPQSHSELDELKREWADTPQVSAALTVVSRAEELESQERWHDAMEKYKLAVDSMLTLLNAQGASTSTPNNTPREPASSHDRRIQLMKRRISKWLTRAEQLQTFIDATELRISEMQQKEVEVSAVEEATAELVSKEQCSLM